MFYFQIYRLVKKKAEILLLATALIACLHSQFDHAFTLLIVMSGHFKALIITSISLKLSYLCQKRLQNFQHSGSRPLR